MNIIRFFLIIALVVASSASPLNSNKFASNQIKKESSEENEIQDREEIYKNNLDRDDKMVMTVRFDELNLVDTEESEFQFSEVLNGNKNKEEKAQTTRRTTMRATTTRRPTTTRRTTKKTTTTKNPITFTRTTTATTTTQS